MAKIVVKNLVKKIGKTTPVNGVTFSVEEGKIFALVGEAGSGKSLIVKLVLGLVHKTSGIAKVDKDSYLGVCLPGSYFDEKASLMEVLKQVASLSSVKITRKRLKNILTLVGLGAIHGAKVKSLNLSQFTRLKLAAAFVCPPQILLLDDAFANLSEEDAFGVRLILKSLVDKLGVTVLLTSQTLRGIEEIYDELYLTSSSK